MLTLNEKRIRRHKRVRAKIAGSTEKPRLCVFRSNNHIYGQLVDDKKGFTIVSASDIEVKKKDTKTSLSKEVGILLAKKAIEKNISQIVFDRGGYQYHGRVKALAEGAREAGLKF
ncbi:MAG: 50S ribosomal protein L18 [Candidatus Pacebacteria bacterium]|nr:50S ribosomal protein L18 [Candidatus Paceibacterota bacterium]